MHRLLPNVDTVDARSVEKLWSSSNLETGSRRKPILRAYDNDHDYLFSQLSVPKATCPEGQSAWDLTSSLLGEKLVACRTNLSGYTCSDFVLLGMQWAWKKICGSLSP